MYDDDEVLENTVKVEPKVKQWEVSIYELSMAYGGPEEGGWWYQTGTLVGLSRRIFNSREAARKYCSRLNDKLGIQNKKLRYGLSSVCYSGGHHAASVNPRGKSSTHFPEYTPHYE